jgi:nicotinic acid mononucleotide adenylyltransferase
MTLLHGAILFEAMSLMDSKTITEQWYQNIALKHGAVRAVEAGYFEESKPWNQTYGDVFGLELLRAPNGITKVIQFSGAFFPFHEGHRDAIQTAINFLNGPVMLVLHIDHKEYRHSKGRCDESVFAQSFALANTLKSKYQIEVRTVFEDKMPDSCSRNFTRLYQELCNVNSQCEIWFLAGGDRASFCLTFLDAGRCLVVGRDRNMNFSAYSKYQNDRILFLPGNNEISSTELRNRNG